MVKREHYAVDLTAGEDDGEPVAQRVKVLEPNHLLCPITKEMFRDPVILMESGHTYERVAIEQHLRGNDSDPLTRDRIRTPPATNRTTRKAVQAWLDENPGVTPDGWNSREMLPATATKPNYAELIRMEDVEGMKRALDKCPDDVNAFVDDVGQSLLALAALRGKLVMVELLVEKGAAVDAKIDTGATPLHIAAHKGHESVVKVLLQKGAAVDAKKDTGVTPLHMAAHKGHESVVKVLLEKGAAVDAKIDTDWTPLHIAAHKGHESVVKVLLEKGAAVDAKSKGNETPLHIAAHTGHESVVKVLLENGAVVDAVNKDN